MARKTTIPIYDGDDFERLGELRREVTIAERRLADAEELARPVATRRLGDDTPDEHPDVTTAREALQQAKDAYDAFLDEAAERAEEWVLHAIGHEEYRALLKEHPPRTEKGEDGKETVHPEDEPFGVNTETFPRALVQFVDPEDDEIRTVVEPKFERSADLKRRIKRLSAGEFDTLWLRAKGLNEGIVGDPKASRYGIATRTSDAT